MDQVPNTFPELFWGYVVVWSLFACYLLWLGAKVRRIERRRDTRS